MNDWMTNYVLFCVPRIAKKKKKKKKREDLQEIKHGKIGIAWIAFSTMHLGWVSSLSGLT